MPDANSAEILREIIKTCVRKLGLLQKADAACCGITVAQCHTLVEIGRANGLSLNELSEALTLDKSTMSRTVDTLVKSGLVERQTNNADRRYTKLTLTAEGTEMVNVINRRMEEFFEQVLNSIPQEKYEAVKDVLPYLLIAVKDTKICFDVRQKAADTIQAKGGVNCE